MKKRSLTEITIPSKILINLIFIIVSLICIVPFILVISVSITDESIIMREGYRLIPSVVNLSAYEYLFTDINQIVRSYMISIIVTASGTLLSLILTAMYAYPLYRKDFPFRKFFAFFIFFTMLFNGGLVPFYIMYTQVLNLRNNLFALIMPFLLNPFFVIIMRTYFTQNIPDSVIESAILDGAGELRILTKIILPLAMPVFATIGLFVTIIYWNDWFMSLLFISKNENISIQYYMYKTMLNIQFMLNNPQAAAMAGSIKIPSETIRMAMAVVGIGPIVIAYPFFQRYFVKGLTVGAIKG
ncbi:MAG: carbohydrate ABC transporter permease [Spirochaetales bacterium]|nr:carbohydrate ABC transporter permease [Spirochaetales bacterium]